MCTREEGDLTVNFVVTDMAKSVTVAYSGILPDLFAEGQGVIAQGRMGPDNVFVAEEVLAKHDETYMPPEVAAALESAGKKHRRATPRRQIPVIPELGQIALLIALALSVVQAVFPLVGAQRGITSWMMLAYPAAHACSCCSCSSRSRC